MTNKLKILIVDDVDDQIEDIMSFMVLHTDLLARERVNLAKEYFDFITFNSVKGAIDWLKSEQCRPDMAFCDLNFGQLPPERYPETERHPQKGKELITWLQQHTPETKIILHTMYIGDDVEIIRKYSDIVFPIDRTSKSLQEGIQEKLREITQKYCLKISRDPRKVAQLSEFMESATTSGGLLAHEVEVGGQKYALKYLFLGWAKAYFDDKPMLEFPDLNTLKNIINACLNSENKTDFVGNLNNDNVLRIINAYLSHQNHDNWRYEIRDDALSIVKETIHRWNGDVPRNPTLENPMLKSFSGNLDSIKKGNSNLDEATVKILLRILTCRLVIVSIHYLKNLKSKEKPNGYFRTIASKHIIDFSALAILKNDEEEFRKQVGDCQEALKKGKKPDVHATVKQLFSTKLGLRGDLAQAQDIEGKSLLKEEKEWLDILEEQLEE